MKTKFIKITAAVFLLSFQGYGQGISQDSMQALNQQKQNIEVSKKLNDRKIELAKLENEFEKKTQEAEKTSSEAQTSAIENQQAAEKLKNDPQNKGLASQANKAARQAERNAKAARKASDDLQKSSSEIADLKGKIAEDEASLGAVATNISSSAPVPALPVQNNSPKAVPGQVIKQNIRLDSSLAKESPQLIADKIVESTYKNYPQQQGQPTIIINNIIVPSDYERQRPMPAARTEMAQSSGDMAEFEEFKAWQRQRQGQQAMRSDMQNRSYAAADSPEMRSSQKTQSSGDKLTFRERFGEKPVRNSGLWVIPVAGIHASNFKADLQDGEADGRIGWNAGLDFRMHAKRFFVQPGAHYFSSSMQVTSEDSVSNAPLLTGPRIHSLKVPVLLGLYLTKANKGFFKANIKAGATGTYVIAVDKSDLAQFDKDNIEEYSYGLNAGLGLEFGFITLDITHEWGMTALFKENNMKNNVLRATIGFKL